MNELMDIGKDEREALAGLFVEILKENDRVRYVSEDGCIKQQNKKTGVILKKMFFEVKFSGAHDILFIEKNKLDSMKKLVRDLDTDKIYYVNFTPRNTAIFDLLKIEEKEKLFFVKQGEKEVAYMDITDATIAEYVYIPKDITSEEYQMFVETGEISNERLTSIAEKVIKQEPITNEEKSVYLAKATEVEQIIKAFISPQPIMEIPSAEPEAFPKEENPNQTTLELKIPERKGIRVDENGQILYNSLEEFQSFPMKIQWLCVAQRNIKRWLKPGEDRLMMIELMGGEIELGNFLKKRFMDEWFKKNY